MINNVKIIKLVDLYTPNLGMSSSAKDLFVKLKNIDYENVEIDFDRVEFMSMAFTQEYIFQKNKSSKNIVEINMSEDISFMLNLINKRLNKF